MSKEVIGKYIAILGLFLFWAFPLGVADAFYPMYSSFQDISLFGTNEPKINPEEISMLKSIVVGFGIFILGLMFLLISVIGLNYRTNWLFWTLLTYSILLLFLIPIGTFLGLTGLIMLSLNRKKFGSDVHVT